MHTVARDAWPDFRYENLAPDVRRDFRAALPIADEDLAKFARTCDRGLADTAGCDCGANPC